MKIDIDRINRIENLIKDSTKDPLKKFVVEPFAEELILIKETNLSNIFKLCLQMKIRYLYLGKGEIAGCENKRWPEENGWPAMWRIVELMEIKGGCGNSDQHQTQDYAGKLFPAHAYGGWDLVERRMLSNEETAQRKFRRVVTRIDR